MTQAGKLDAITLRAYKNFDKILEAIGEDASISDENLESMIKTVESMATDNAVDNLNDYREQLSKIEEAYTAFKEGKRIDSAMLSGLQNAFGENTEAYRAYLQLKEKVMAGNTDLQESFNNLATALATHALDNMG